jgi:hypothetical protein
MICENEVYVGGPPDGDRDICWNPAVTKCADCNLRLCIGCVDTCENACHLCDGCIVDHEKKTGHRIHPSDPPLLSDEGIDALAKRVAEIVGRHE